MGRIRLDLLQRLSMQDSWFRSGKKTNWKLIGARNLLQTENLTAPETGITHNRGIESFPVFSLKRFLRRSLFAPVLRTRAKRLGPYIFDSLHDCSSILDFGCGDMILTEFLKSSSPERHVVGIDTIDSNLSNLPLLLYDGTALPFEDNAFDAVIVGFVLHHCSNIEDILIEIKRVARKKIIIFEEVYTGGLNKKILHCHDFGNRLLSWKMEIPLNFLTLEDWLKKFKDLNLYLKDFYRVYQYPFFNLTHQLLFELAIP